MKKSSFLINTSRGPIVNEDDLIIALSTNEIAGAGLDVYSEEPPKNIENIGNNNFSRIRIGIGKPREKSMTNKYVLSKFTKEEGKIVNNINNLAEDIISAIVFQSISFAMNTFNSKIQ